jgi:hypothetical protein
MPDRQHSGQLRIFIGFDERQPVSYNVLQHSIVARASRPVAITPLVLSTLPITRRGLTPFTFSRFLVPWLCGYRGWALFLDLDMLVLGDIAELFGYAQKGKAVIVCKEQQRFEWASAMLFDCGHPANAVLTPEFVQDEARCKAPHSINWFSDESLIGSFPAEWNHCVGYNAPRPGAKLAHYTQGIPAFPEIRGCEYSDEWWSEFRHCGATQPWLTLMGRSVHVVKMPDGRIVPKLSEEGRAETARLQAKAG